VLFWLIYKIKNNKEIKIVNHYLMLLHAHGTCKAANG
jgi:hypothetical protein